MEITSSGERRSRSQHADLSGDLRFGRDDEVGWRRVFEDICGVVGLEEYKQHALALAGT
jgi:hypothetical protein